MFLINSPFVRAILTANMLMVMVGISGWPRDALGQNVELVGQLGGAVNDVVVQGGFAYIGEGPRLVVLDVTEPSIPSRRGSVILPDLVQGIAVSGTVAYVAADGAGLFIVDVSNPSAPTLLGSYDTPGESNGVAVSGSVAYIADGGSGLQIVDASNPHAPTLRGSYDTSGIAWNVVVSGTVAYVADGNSGLQLLNVSTPSPTFLGSRFAGDARGVAVSGTIATVAGYDGLHIIDVSNPAALDNISSLDTSGSALDVFVSGSVAFIAGQGAGLQMVDISSPAAPRLLGTYNTPGTARGVAVAGSLAYVADAWSGCQIVDVSDRSEPFLLTVVETLGEARSVAVEGTFAYVGASLSGFWIADVSDPSAPTPMGSLGIHAGDVAVSGGLACVVSGLEVQIVDISNPSSLRLLGSYEAPYSVKSVALSASVAYVYLDRNLQIVDISTPSSPALLGSFTTQSFASGVTVSGMVAFAADAWGLWVVDVSVPSAPTFIGSYRTGGRPGAVAVSGTVAYVAESQDGALHILDVSIPSVPSLFGIYDPPGREFDVAVSETFAYVADEAAGLQVVGVTNPYAPALLGELPTPGTPEDVAAVGDVAYMASGDGGLLILQYVPSPSPTPTASPTPTPTETPSPTPSPTDAPSATPTTSPTADPSQSPSPTPSPTVSPSPTPTPSPSATPIQAVSNISTRGFVSTGSDVMIGGLIVSAPEGSVGGPADARRVLVSGIGPDLANFGVPGVLANPSLLLLRGQTVLSSNDDWEAADPALVAEIRASGKAPGNSLEAAILATLEPGEYTAILTGVAPDGSPDSARTGVGLVQAFDLGPAPGASGGGRLSNISTRLAVGTGDRVMIGGFTIEGPEGAAPKEVLVRGLGPTLGRSPFDVPGALGDPELVILEGQTVRETNANWRDHPQSARIESLGLAPPDDLEPAILISLEPGAYTAIVSGAGGTSGVALIEVYETE